MGQGFDSVYILACCNSRPEMKFCVDILEDILEEERERLLHCHSQCLEISQPSPSLSSLPRLPTSGCHVTPCSQGNSVVILVLPAPVCVCTRECVVSE